ncbi:MULTISPECIES: DUF1853 family protein [unclassified Acinetobacter]|uniref:DUF1853 family protein n=1 Tax=unclassified Acinetobacter TaxID=196816 RepID=UPI0029352E5C|nr:MULTISPECIES: DUF1853 family protein [unclassified Acinetobacter]WOE33106.1 DUF1853 family protein [Acinetobacter sp. SAAs470]WOE39932.1 DUF1853 family protein [Acinetobacter sp. SAAs474]
MPLFTEYDDNELWLRYQTPIVRQLAFALISPNIIQKIPNQLNILHPFSLHPTQFWSQLFSIYQPRLDDLDRHPEVLYDFLNRLKSTRLGLRFESLIWFWLNDHAYHAYQLLGHSIQIIDGPRTIGELDFLLKNTETNQIEHWEVALKYYLGEQRLSLMHWYGLNRSDTLFRKINHFTQKQFQFSQALNHVIDLKFAVLKGQLYLPLSHGDIPDWINLDRRLGLWGNTLPQNHSDYIRLSRHEWLCPNLNTDCVNPQWWTDGLYLNPQYQQYYMYKRPPLFSQFNKVPRT